MHAHLHHGFPHVLSPSLEVKKLRKSSDKQLYSTFGPTDARSLSHSYTPAADSDQRYQINTYHTLSHTLLMVTRRLQAEGTKKDTADDGAACP